MAGQDGTNIGASITRLQVGPGGDGHLACVSLILLGVEVEVARLRHNIDTGLARICLRLLLDTSTVGVNLLRFKIDLLADQVRITGRVGKCRLIRL